jgi:hypothetical protein
VKLKTRTDYEGGMKGIYEITLKAKDGMERKMIAFLPTEETKQNLCLQARKRGLEAELRQLIIEN